jgi:hypothetical protein
MAADRNLTNHGSFLNMDARVQSTISVKTGKDGARQIPTNHGSIINMDAR